MNHRPFLRILFMTFSRQALDAQWCKVEAHSNWRLCIFSQNNSMFLILRQILILFPHQTYKLNDLVYVVVSTLLKLIHTVISNLFCILYISIAAYECTANYNHFKWRCLHLMKHSLSYWGCGSINVWIKSTTLHNGT